MHTYFQGKRLLIIVTGSIAAYKILDLISQVRKLKCEVRVVMSASAQEFICPLSFEAMTQHPVYTELFAESTLHIDLAKWADAILIAPATANTLAKMAHGLAEDLVGNILLATKTPILLAPAMNQAMWSHPATQRNVAILKERDHRFVGPVAGVQACGDEGVGNMADPEDILLTLPVLWQPKKLAGKTVIVTAGGTREAIDPVRFLSNRSSGKMGYALAKACFYAGAEVSLVATITRPLPSGIQLILVEAVSEMLDTALKKALGLDPCLRGNDSIFIAAAAPCDFRVKSTALQKIKKTQGFAPQFVENEDIVMAMRTAYPTMKMIGFAAETENLLENAKAKLAAKKLDMIIANSVAAGQGFEVDENEAMVLSKDKAIQLPKQSKEALAWEIISAL